MLSWTLKYVAGPCDPGGHIGFDVLIGVTGNQMSLLPYIREMTPVGRWEPVSQVPKECWLFPNFQKHS